MAFYGAVLLLVALTMTLTETKVVFHRPDVLEVETPDQNMLFVHEPSMEETLRQTLTDHEANDEGAFTPWLNLDHPRMSGGSTGDYEWVREARYREYAYGECLVPCADDDIEAMEVDVMDTEEDNFIVENCLGLEDGAYQPSYGFFCMNTDQRGPKAKCRNNPTCQERFMTSECQCPDFSVRYFCLKPTAQREQYCEDVVSKYQARKNGKRAGPSYLRDVRAFLDGNVEAEEGAAVQKEQAPAVVEKASLSKRKSQEDQLISLLKKFVLQESQKS